MARNNYRKRTGKISNKASVSLHPALGNLKERLSSPRLKAPTTIKSYMETAKRFLSTVGDTNKPTDSNVRQYFMKRRDGGVSERSLTKEFFHLKKLFIANNWPWAFTKDDTPYAEEKKQLPLLEPSNIEKLIAARAKYTNGECFYLAVATTFIVRREELARIKKRDYDEETIIIHTAKHGRRRQHLIPEPLRPIFQKFRAKEHATTTLSIMFRRICEKAEVKLPPRSSWHSIRYTLTTLIRDALIRGNYDPALVADYGGWSKQSLGTVFGGAPMVGYYRRPEILFTDKFGSDRVIYEVHPFLHLWQEKPVKKTPVKD
jgi:integrase